MTTNTEGLLDEKAAATRLGVSPERLRYWRSQGGGPRFHKLGALVRYSPDALAAFLKETEREPGTAKRTPKPKTPTPRRRRAASGTPSATPAPAQAAA